MRGGVGGPVGRGEGVARIHRRGGRRARTLPLAASLMAALLAAVAACGERDGGEAGEERPPEAELIAARTLGLAYLQEDRLGEAEEEFAKLVRWTPDEPSGYANLALVSIRRGDYEEAERLAREALERAPDDPDLRLVLATVLERTGRADAARRELERSLETAPDHLRTHYALAQLRAGGGAGTPPGRPGAPGPEADPAPPAAADMEAARRHLARAVELTPANVAARVQLAELLLGAGEAAPVAAHMEELRARLPAFPEEAEPAFDGALSAARRGDAGEALPAFRRFHDILRLTAAYQAGMQELEGPRTAGVGFPALTFSWELSVEVPEEGAVLEAMRFTDATEFAGLGVVGGGPGADGGRGAGGQEAAPGAGAAGAAAVLAAGDFDGDGDGDLFVWSSIPDGGRGHLLRNDLGRFVDVSAEAGVTPRGGVRAALFTDLDNDGRPDLYLVREGANVLYRNLGDGTFRDASEEAGVADPGAGRAAVAVDADHDGDLDLFVANAGPDRLYRNDGDGGFTEMAAAMGLEGGPVETRAVAFLDFDGDADIDLLLATAEGLRLLENHREARFEEVAAARGLTRPGPVAAVAVGDYDNDGLLDVFAAGGSAGPGAEADGADGAGGNPAATAAGATLYRNVGDGSFQADRRSADALGGLARLEVRGAAFLDFDNDGHLDLLVSGRPRDGARGGAVLLRNDGTGRFRDRSDKLPETPGPFGELEVTDYNEDGDLDLLMGREAGVRLLRNDGANANHHFQITLIGRGPGSGKNNHFGIGSRIEVRAGDLYQTRTATEPTSHLGLGQRLKPDVIRVVWTNGVPQILYYPGTDQDLIEDQTLKGSCAFVYAWDGERFRFVTDAMWRSALGMPVGIMGGAGTTGSGDSPASRRVYATPRASREYLRIPPGYLRPENGVYRLRITEELWEVAYLDEAKLVALDHPDSVEVFLDERFVPPGPPVFRPYGVARRHLPRSAADGRGADVLPALRAADDVYVSDLKAGPYQGITEPHDLVLDLGEPAASADSVFLFLQGWIFPTDASVNVAVSQSGAVEVLSPRLQVPDGQGGWRTAIEDLGFPAGKAKTVVADLSGLLVPGDPRVRIRTNMQVYWDHAFYATGPSGGDAVGAPAEGLGRGWAPGLHGGRVTVLRPGRAEVRYRGFSREYRKGGRHGPHWFDYEDVSTAPRWLPISGRYTRYGDVLPLLLEPDDRYVILAPGDEVPLEFPAAELPAPPAGWTRTFFLYTDGWIKDADLNTATGNTVAPLPFHGMSRYPYGPEETFPAGAAHRRWDETYNTRVVGPGDRGSLAGRRGDGPP